jgi:hypothetical protein
VTDPLQAPAGRAKLPNIVRRAAARAAEPLADMVHVARYLTELSRFQVRADDVFISSYPRSGTTWLQHILHVLSHGRDTGFRHIADVVPWFERTLALGQHRARDFDRIGSPRFFKSHLPHDWLPKGARYLYAVRDGRDVAVSYYHFYRSYLGYSGSFDEFFERFLDGDLQYRSWFDHVARWRRHAADARVLWVEYERLLHDRLAVLNEIASFCGIPLSGARLTQVAPLISFDYMKHHEARFDHATSVPGAASSERGRFVRRGREGGYRALFSQAQSRAFDARLQKRTQWALVELRLASFLR